LKNYVTATGIVFGWLCVVHVWRAIEEGPRLATDPWFLLISVLALGFCVWACRLLWQARKS
jgi:hypothetical protein